MPTILIVDDSASLRQVVTMALKGSGYNTVEAKDGEDALSKLKMSSIDMIVCDVNMPVMNGLDFVRQVKSDAKYKFLPVLMLTTETTDEKKQVGKAAGASGWMVKPFAPTQLVKAVVKFVGAA